MIPVVRPALVAIAVVLVLAGCGGGKSAKSTTTIVTTAASSTGGSSTTVITHGRFHYPPALIRNYMNSCVSGGGAKKQAYCACTLDKLSNSVSTRDFAEIGLAHGKIPPRIKRFLAKAVADCANKL